MKILYVQYTNPAAYPPLQHSSRMLASAGWRVRFLGIDVAGVEDLVFDPRPGIDEIRLRGAPPGVAQKIHYAGFMARAVAEALRWRPDRVYVSDPIAAPAGLLLASLTGAGVVYHEHDSPIPTGAESGFQRVILRARAALARRADLCIVPNHRRAADFVAETGTTRPVHVVWNCPERGEVRSARPARRGPLRVLYHGSIVPARLPLSVVESIARLDDVHLVIAGYEPQGAAGYCDEIRARAHRLGIGDRIDFRGPQPRREDILAVADGCDVGLALMPLSSDDPNQRTMEGASNKAFDYLARGLGVIVSDLPAWRAIFVDAGCALVCDPSSPESIAAAVRTLRDDRALLATMVERGRDRVLGDWSYEAQFAEVFEALNAPRGARFELPAHEAA